MFKNFDPAKHIISFRGIVILGPASGTFCSAERHEDTYSYKYGAHGDMARTRNRKRGGRISVTLMGVSPTNDQLSAVHIIDERTGLGYGAFQIVDLNGTTVCHANNAWIVRPPNFSVADEHTDREWQFDCENIDMLIGGATV
jgi:hypothetical protein